MAAQLPRRALAILVTITALCFGSGSAFASAGPADRFFRTSDGVRLHYIEVGQGPTIVFVPGWTMPADIWAPQIRHFAGEFHVVALDPRGQGKSEIARDGYSAERRARDIRDLIVHLGGEPVVLVGWSLGVLDSLAYVKFSGTDRLRALVLVDNSIGEEPPPAWDPTFLARLKKNRVATTERFVHSMYHTPQSAAYYERIIRSSLRMPLDDAVSLLSYPFPREFWKQVVYQTDRPILYAVNERFRGQAENLKKNRPGVWIRVFEHAGHALFVDDAHQFNSLLDEFLEKEVGLQAATGR